jgi:phosphoribosylformylglycinamidine synthase
MLSGLKELIPGAGAWPNFLRNDSEQFEARFSMVEIMDSPSLFFNAMAGSRFPVAVAHGEGRAVFDHAAGVERMLGERMAAVRFVDGHGRATESYPDNPNGSPGGLTGLTTPDGRFTIMMPHPERVFRTLQNSCLAPGGVGRRWSLVAYLSQCARMGRIVGARHHSPEGLVEWQVAVLHS